LDILRLKTDIQAATRRLKHQMISLKESFSS